MDRPGRLSAESRESRPGLYRLGEPHREARRRTRPLNGTIKPPPGRLFSCSGQQERSQRSCCAAPGVHEHSQPRPSQCCSWTTQSACSPLVQGSQVQCPKRVKAVSIGRIGQKGAAVCEDDGSAAPASGAFFVSEGGTCVL